MNRKRSYLQLKTRIYRYVAAYMALNIFFEVVSPTLALALTGGPSQPEVQSFEPVGTSDMVDPFSGDFNYNIPLLDVDGYPINIAYHSGITMDQEASWVGLGWNINAGVINRAMRGLPDDFDGDKVTKQINMKPNRTYGLNGGVGAEFFGAFGVDIGMGIHYNNYNGVGIENSVNLSLSAGNPSKATGTLGLGITSSSDDGLSLNPSLSFSAKVSGNENTATTKLGASVGTSFNSRGGLKTLSINTTVSTSVNTGYKNKVKGKDQAGNPTEKLEDNQASYGGSTNSTFDFGMPTYTPMAGPSMRNYSITGNFKLGSEIYPIHPHFTVGGYYSSQELSTKTIVSPAYGYMNADEGTKYDNALLDFNREKDGPFTPHTPTLPVTNFSYDIYSVSGQGVGGSYRPFRSDMGHVFDPSTNTTSDGISTGFEIGIGNLTHFGFDLSVTDVQTRTGRWSTDNPAAARLTSRATSPDPAYEKYYFKEANEKSVDADPTFFANAGGSSPKSVKLNAMSRFHTATDVAYTSGEPIPADNYRKQREKRNQPITTLSRSELAQYGLENIPGLLTEGTADNQAKGHHIAEVTALRSDGSRYVYGIAAYNTSQKEVTFATGSTLDGTLIERAADANSGLVTYIPSAADNSLNNQMGLDNYYSSTNMPAYAHSYMLTAVLSPDYVDSENNGTTTRGPSDGDIGNYTKFNYTKVDNYQWRLPVDEFKATYNEGLKSDTKDDKANYIYGTKELWYLSSIETKNYIAIFTTEDRADGYGVKGENGGVDASCAKMKRLTRISLYVKREYQANPSTAVPVKEVHFEYDYSLCPDVPNNINFVNSTGTNTGKLTLKKIYFTYQHSNKARLSPYEFTYSSSNPGYNIKGYDRWGNYKPNMVYDFNPLNPLLSTAEYPYVEQNQTNADTYAQAWSLTDIDLPSGGHIQVDYESDDYAYVQDRQAMQMFKVVAVEDNSGNFFSSTPTIPSAGTAENINFTNGTRLIIQLQSVLTGTAAEKILAFKQQYLGGPHLENFRNLYFRFLMNIRGSRYEYVSGYIQPNRLDINNISVDASGQYACIPVNNVTTNDVTGSLVCPITKAAIQYGRLNMSRVVWNAADLDASVGDHGSFGKDLLEAIINSDFTRNIADAVTGPNEALYGSRYNVGHSAVMAKSWIRLNNPNKKKLGGGCRVKKIQISDDWYDMTAHADNSFSYGQEYSYTLEDGTSSGVAAYEPQLGGDENPFRQPVFFEEKNLLAPDDEHYVEEPFGESFFPSPNVGYSRVTVKNLQYATVKHHATGAVVHEFYTAKDFPTITGHTDMSSQHDKTSPVSIAALLKIDVKDYMTTSQGYVIELNDMHGKPKKQSVYQEGQTDPITSVEYHYRSNPWLNGASRLNNQETVIYSDGTVENNRDIGVFFDFVSDMREHKTTTISGSINGNVDGFLAAAYPVYVPIIIPQFARERTQYRSSVITKVVNRFGILEETVAKDLGSTVSTRNLAYDAETGTVLVTQTTTDYNDAVYSMTYPAHWYYDGMGPAYRNIGFSKAGLVFTGGMATVTNAPSYFAEGDELELSDGTTGWVLEVNPSGIHVITRNGNNVNGTLNVKVLRSGRKNQQDAAMASITTLSNPLSHFRANIYDNVLQAQSVEYTNAWRTFCDCFTGSDAYSSNPYITGTKGMYKKKKSYLYLSGRTQSNYDNNTNIRKDGVFTSYTPFYKLNNAGKWQIDGSNWTYTSEVTEFSPFGAELENKDALGRYSAATYGYNQTFPTAVAANAQYKQVGFDNFEDYDFSACADNHFKFRSFSASVNATQSHTGNRSIKVSHGTAVNMTKQIAPCTITPACNLGLTDTYDSDAGTHCISVSGGTAPYAFDWQVINCDLGVTIDNAGDKICTGVSSGCSIRVTVTDRNNCTITKTFSLAAD